MVRGQQNDAIASPWSDRIDALLSRWIEGALPAAELDGELNEIEKKCCLLLANPTPKVSHTLT